ncbi:zinc finger CCCH domain-containing protein 3 [Candoia aspera]|uniref:zinc finger CCCH domain-containing protein 3 n=1 Tax=Candoia aspera TaxID=51853 RepID=UPI002FD7A6AD
MEQEQERLRRQIRLLQGLINDHKNAHGNAPVPPPASLSRWRNPKLPAFHNQAAFSARYGPQPSRDFLPCQGSTPAWRKKYSLVNIPPRPALPSASSTSAGASWMTQSQASSEGPEPQPMPPETTAVSRAVANAGVQAGSKAGDAAGPGFQQGSSGAGEGPSASRGSVQTATWPLNAGSEQNKELRASAWPHLPHCKTVASGGNGPPAGGQKKPVAGKALIPNLCRTASEGAVALKSEPQQPLALPERGTGSLPVRKKPGSQVSYLYGSQHHPAGAGKLSPTGVVDLSAGCAHSAGEASSSAETNLPQDKPSISLVQKSSSLPASVKSSLFKKANYTWVANPSKSPQSVKRWGVSRASEITPKFAVCAAAAPKLQSRGANLDLGAKPKKSSPHSKLAVSSSQYKWKAAGLRPAPPTSASVFTWQRKECTGPGGPPCAAASTSLQALRRVPLGHGRLGQGNPRPFFGNTGFFNYKLRSWSKIIKRKGSSCLPAVLLKSRYCLRKRNSLRGRPSPPTRRTATKGLVQIGKHRLRRLPASRVPVLAKEGSSFLLVASPAANRVVNTRYRLVKKTAASPLTSAASLGSPSSHGWKARKLSSSRSLIPNSARHPSPGNKCQAVHRWRNKGLRCIGGVMYRVSANKLSKTSSSPARNMEVATRSHARGARLDSAHGVPGYSPPGWPSRSTTSRYIASRAVQRSLAIIRQARQRKDRRKEYCMYYNRFGKCNRGESCPYIHDPEKVAVCTRFLRGTCKKTDGTCPFAHKVSKDKMPVCSYFLKGICNNSDCPYSHVYVSRKAEVCADFLKGYCPLGEKCKKKHTLVCPDFLKHGVCPKGSQCKLQHPQKKRLAKQASPRDSCPAEHSAPAPRNYANQTLRRKAQEEEEEGGAPWHPKSISQTSRLTKQPSFISLQSPPASPCAEEGPKPERNGEEAGKPLQIKPRL